MGWSITLIGKPENVAKALEENTETLNGQSKIEYDSALPHMVALVKENFGADNHIIKITAAGRGWIENRQCIVNIECIYGTLV